MEFFCAARDRSQGRAQRARRVALTPVARCATPRAGRRSGALSRELRRRQIPQRAMRAFLVVLPLPRRDLAPRVEQVFEPTDVQAFFPQPPVEALQPPVLRRLAGLDVVELDLPLQTPRQKMPAG